MTDEYTLPSRTPGLPHLLDYMAGIGIGIAGEELGLQFHERIVVREALAALTEMRARRGPAIGFVE